jgi:hypothetical protein
LEVHSGDPRAHDAILDAARAVCRDAIASL